MRFHCSSLRNVFIAQFQRLVCIYSARVSKMTLSFHWFLVYVCVLLCLQETQLRCYRPAMKETLQSNQISWPEQELMMLMAGGMLRIWTTGRRDNRSASGGRNPWRERKKSHRKLPRFEDLSPTNRKLAAVKMPDFLTIKETLAGVINLEIPSSLGHQNFGISPASSTGVSSCYALAAWDYF